jgi:hypothetical protein
LIFLLFLVKLTPTFPNLVEFLGKRRRSQLLGYLGLEETILDEILVDFGSLRPSEAIGQVSEPSEVICR